MYMVFLLCLTVQAFKIAIGRMLHRPIYFSVLFWKGLCKSKHTVQLHFEINLSAHMICHYFYVVLSPITRFHASSIKACAVGQSFDPHHTTQGSKEHLNQFRAKYAKDLLDFS
jgi:hypothetical protein